MTRETFFVEGSIPVEALEDGVRRREGRSIITLQGVIRPDRDGGGQLDHVVYEADLVRAQEEVDALVQEIPERWRGADILFRHRLGRVRVGETSVFLAVTADRREDALGACHHAMERVRHLAGLRKRDVFRDGTARLSLVPRTALILSDDALTLPQS